jgi:hypothetical protein
MDRSEIDRMIRSGELMDGLSLTGFLLYTRDPS